MRLRFVARAVRFSLCADGTQIGRFIRGMPDRLSDERGAEMPPRPIDEEVPSWDHTTVQGWAAIGNPKADDREVPEELRGRLGELPPLWATVAFVAASRWSRLSARHFKAAASVACAEAGVALLSYDEPRLPDDYDYYPEPLWVPEVEQIIHRTGGWRRQLAGPGADVGPYHGPRLRLYLRVADAELEQLRNWLRIAATKAHYLPRIEIDEISFAHPNEMEATGRASWGAFLGGTTAVGERYELGFYPPPTYVHYSAEWLTKWPPVTASDIALMLKLTTMGDRLP